MNGGFPTRYTRAGVAVCGGAHFPPLRRKLPPPRFAEKVRRRFRIMLRFVYGVGGSKGELSAALLSGQRDYAVRFGDEAVEFMEMGRESGTLGIHVLHPFATVNGSELLIKYAGVNESEYYWFYMGAKRNMFISGQCLL